MDLPKMKRAQGLKAPKYHAIHVRTFIALRAEECLVAEAACINLSHKAEQLITGVAGDQEELLLLSIIVIGGPQKHG